jgi:hypothetical protein
MKIFALIGIAGVACISFIWINNKETTPELTFVSANVDWSISLPTVIITPIPVGSIEFIASQNKNTLPSKNVEIEQAPAGEYSEILTTLKIPSVNENPEETWKEEAWYQRYEKEHISNRRDTHSHLQNIQAMKTADGVFLDPVFQRIYEQQGISNYSEISLPTGNRSLIAEKYMEQLIRENIEVQTVSVRCNGLSCWMIGYYQMPDSEVYDSHIVTEAMDDACEAWHENIWECKMKSIWSISSKRSINVGFYANTLFDNDFKESDVPFGFLDSGALLLADELVIEGTIQQYIDQMIYKQKDETHPPALLKRIRCKKDHCKITVSNSRYEDISGVFSVINYGIAYKNQINLEKSYYLMDGVRHYLSPGEEVPSNAVVGSVTSTKFSDNVKRLYDFSRYCMEVVGRNKVKKGKLYYDTKWHCEVAENG